MDGPGNTSLNGTAIPSSGTLCRGTLEASTAWKVGSTLVYCVVLASAIAGNFILTGIIFKTKSMRKTINFFIANMSTCDLLFSTFVLPKVITEFSLGHQRWLVGGVFGLSLCKLVPFFQDVTFAVSIQSLVLIAADRFGAVVYPLRPPLFSTKTRGLSIAFTWVVSLALHSPYLLTRQTRDTPNGLVCYVDWEAAFGKASSFEPYFISLFFLLVVAPICLLIILYTIIIVKLKEQSQPRNLTISKGERQRRLRQERKVLKMAVAIVVGFGLCMAPFCVYAFMFMFVWHNRAPCYAKTIKTPVMFLFYASCAVNPCVCFKFNTVFRQAFMDVLRCRRRHEGSLRRLCSETRKSTLRGTRSTAKESRVDMIELHN